MIVAWPMVAHYAGKCPRTAVRMDARKVISARNGAKVELIILLIVRPASMSAKPKVDPHVRSQSQPAKSSAAQLTNVLKRNQMP